MRQPQDCGLPRKIRNRRARYFRRLRLEQLEGRALLAADNDTNDQLTEAASLNIGAAPFSAGITEGIDVDMYKFTATSGQFLEIDLDLTGGDLDSYMRLFSSAGAEITSNDDGVGPNENYSYDSYLK